MLVLEGSSVCRHELWGGCVHEGSCGVAIGCVNMGVRCAEDLWLLNWCTGMYKAMSMGDTGMHQKRVQTWVCAQGSSRVVAALAGCSPLPFPSGLSLHPSLTPPLRPSSRHPTAPTVPTAA